MSAQFYAFPKIAKFHSVVSEVKQVIEKCGAEFPVISYSGTVKLHGTNGAIVFHKSDSNEFTVQSRSRILDGQNDNANFAASIRALPKQKLLELRDKAVDVVGDYEQKLMFVGEWCGQGVQKGVAISKLDKFFCIFAIKRDHTWIFDPAVLSQFSLEEHRIYNIGTFKTFSIKIDFSKIDDEAYSTEINNKIIEWTEGIGHECPVAKHFGESGPGEGIVWAPIHSNVANFNPNNDSLWFKTKIEDFSPTKGPVISEKPDVVKTIEEFITNTVTEVRLDQGMKCVKDELQCDLKKEHIHAFVTWMVNDIMKEEGDVLQESRITEAKDLKAVKTQIGLKSRNWLLQKLKEQ